MESNTLHFVMHILVHEVSAMLHLCIIQIEHMSLELKINAWKSAVFTLRQVSQRKATSI